MKTKTTLGILAVLTLPAAVRAQSIDGGAVRTPDERGHLRKMTEEMIRLSRTKKPDAKADLFARIGEERLRELESMQRKGSYAYSRSLGSSYDRYAVRGFSGAVEMGASRGCDMTGALGRYAEATAKHTAVLERVLASAPEAARKGLLNALEASRHGHEQAIRAHLRGKGKFGAGGGADRPGGEDRPGGGKPGGVGRPGGDEEHGRPSGKGRPGGEDKPGHAGPPPGKGDPEGGSGPGKGKPRGPDAPGRGNEGPPPGKGGKDESPKGKNEGRQQGPPPGNKGKGKGGP
jgi:hypothetical protein